MIDIDPGTIFAASLLVGGFLAGALVLLIALFLAAQMIWRHVRDKRDEGRELREEQAMAVAVAEAHVRQHFYDNGSEQGASI